MYCIENHFVSIEFVEALERIARKWSAFQWRRAAYLCGLAYNFVEDSQLARLPLPSEYRVSRKLGSIAAQIVQSGDKVAIRVYAISFGDGPFKPGRYLHRLAGRGYLRESFHICGVGRTKRVFEGYRVPWRHIPRNDSSANGIHAKIGETIDFSSTNDRSPHYSANAALTSDNARTWAPNGSHDSSLRGRIQNLQSEDSLFEHDANGYFARLQPYGSPSETAYCKGARTADNGIEAHDDFKFDDDILDVVWNQISMPICSSIYDKSPAFQTALFPPPSRMRTLASPHHDTTRTHGPGKSSPRPHVSPRVH